MDINTLRALVTLVVFVTFVAIVWWAYAPARKARFERDARSIFEDEKP